MTDRNRHRGTRWSVPLARSMVVALGLALLPPFPVQGQQLYIYPEKGQSKEQQSEDQGECHQWAVEQSGVNPALQTGPDRGPDGSVVRGAAGGAAVGAIAGAVAGDAGKGAAAGAAGGALLGGLRRRGRTRSQEQVQAQGQEAYKRALVACLQGRGYSVN